MFCPKCATPNPDGVGFCRSCGANISMVPQALSGELQQSLEEEGNKDASCLPMRKRGRGEGASVDAAFRNAFMGLGFLFVAIALAFSIGRGWWFWMLIPAFSMMGTGVAQYIRYKEQEKKAMRGQMAQQAFQPAGFQPRVTAFTPRRNTGELVEPPPSVTEGTTRHLGAEAQTRHLDPTTER